MQYVERLGKTIDTEKSAAQSNKICVQTTIDKTKIGGCRQEQHHVKVEKIIAFFS